MTSLFHRPSLNLAWVWNPGCPLSLSPSCLQLGGGLRVPLFCLYYSCLSLILSLFVLVYVFLLMCFSP